MDETPALSENLPGRHCEHALWVVSANVPAGQVVHAKFMPPSASATEPSLHFSQLRDDESFAHPAGQKTHEDPPSSNVVRCVGHSVHDAEPGRRA